MFDRYSTTDAGRIYVMCHFNHPAELTAVAKQGLQCLQDHSVITINQTPMIRGINDSPGVLSELLSELSYLGVPPYYVFQCRPTEGNESYSVPIEEGYRAFASAVDRVSGLAKRARFSMSHSTGKIEIVGLTADRIIFKYHRAADPRNAGRLMLFRRNPDACWFDDYLESRDYPSQQPDPRGVAAAFQLGGS